MPDATETGLDSLSRAVYRAVGVLNREAEKAEA